MCLTRSDQNERGSSFYDTGRREEEMPEKVKQPGDDLAIPAMEKRGGDAEKSEAAGR